MSKANEPVFVVQDVSKNQYGTYELGITKREYFAAKAMEAFIAATFTNTGGQCVGITGADGRTENATPEAIAKFAVNYANAVIKELEKESE